MFNLKKLFKRMMNNSIDSNKLDIKPCQFKDAFSGKSLSENCPLGHCEVEKGK